jgi:hypothetical protein
MAKRLLQRQASLIHYLTSAATIFGEDGRASPPSAVRGIDPNLLHVEAHFAYAKRMEKITAILPKTFELLGSREQSIVHAFIETCPPASIGRLENARQFRDFLSACCERILDPPYLPDVAACELACAEVDAGRNDQNLADEESDVPPRGIRRCRTVVLLRCAYDIRPIFEAGLGPTIPSKRATPLVVAMAQGSNDPQVFEVIPAVFELLAALDDWTDPSTLGDAPEVAQLLKELVLHGLIERRR